jgi:hypothetical protein
LFLFSEHCDGRPVVSCLSNLQFPSSAFSSFAFRCSRLALRSLASQFHTFP